jgi:hypothetical protein
LADGWCWFVLREKYCWLVGGGWFVLREKYCWLVADKPNQQGNRSLLYWSKVLAAILKKCNRFYFSIPNRRG